MAKPLLLGTLASMTLGAITAIGLNVFDASGEVGGIAFVLAACVAGLIGAEVAHRLPPPPQQPH